MAITDPKPTMQQPWSPPGVGAKYGVNSASDSGFAEMQKAISDFQTQIQTQQNQLTTLQAKIDEHLSKFKQIQSLISTEISSAQTSSNQEK